MATIQPFAALRPRPDLAARLCELPYDVMSSEEARLLAAGNPLSFLHVSKPEIDLPPGLNPCDPQVYATGRKNFTRLIAEGALCLDAQPCFYLYRQVMGNHSQTGLVAVASCEEYLQGMVRKHELTRPDKEDDRVRHIEALDAQTGPVFLVYPALPAIDALVRAKTAGPPVVDFVAADGVRHSAWTLAEPEDVRLVETAFARLPRLYIADGHHRSAAAARVYQSRQGTGQSGRFLAVIFPHDQVRILPYNRVLKDWNGQAPGAVWKKMEEVFSLSPTGGENSPNDGSRFEPMNRGDLARKASENSPSPIGWERAGVRVRGEGRGEGAPPVVAPTCVQNLGNSLSASGQATPAAKHEVCVYADRQWRTLKFRSELTGSADPIERLDVTLLQKHVLGPIFGIDDPRTSKRIDFVGGIRGPDELERLVNNGPFVCAFSMFPTSIADLMTIADAGGIMPPKSTWFEPKLRDAMFCHLI